MCIEVYSTEQPVQIPFEHECLRFITPHSFRGRYSLLIRNAGYRPISVLSVIYPRPLYDVPERPDAVTGKFPLCIPGLRSITASLPDSSPFFGRPRHKRLQMRLPDPNNPTFDLPLLDGYWDHENTRLQLPATFTRSCALLLNEHGFTGWEFRLTEPIAPQDAHWFWWEITVKDVGDLLRDSLYGPVVFHQIASPVDVRRTITESMQSALKDVHEHGPEDAKREERIRRVLDLFGLRAERQVDIQYYELTVETGNPIEQFLLSWQAEGDIRLRGGSPRVGRHTQWDKERLHEPIYEWKSGSILEPPHPWRDGGFMIRLALGCARGTVSQPPT